jgi:predicted RNA-binding protein
MRPDYPASQNREPGFLISGGYMDKRNYWLDLFTGTTWSEFKKAGSKVTGFRQSKWKTVQKIKEGDYFLCYLTGISRFIGILEVTSEPYQDETPIWSDEYFPCRFKVRPIIELNFETAVPVHNLKDSLSCFRNLKNPNAWTGAFRGSPAQWSTSDGKAVVKALQEAQENPIEHPFDEKRLKYRPKAFKAKIGSVTVPDTEDENCQEPGNAKVPTEHTEIQWLLLQLGSDMGFHVWVARNDRGKDFRGKKFSDLPKLKTGLPLQFDDATNRTIEMIDVLWLKGSAIAAAFEIESTTSIYSGLLRMSDLIAMQPNLNIPLYLVAPDDRRDKVMNEVNRPTFAKLSPPLCEICKFISFSGLKTEIKKAAPYLKVMKSEFLDIISESCELEDA